MEFDFTELANAKTAAELDAASKKLNDAIAERKGGAVMAEEKKRLEFLDELRGLCIFLMVFYHAFFLLMSVFASAWGEWLYAFFQPWQPAVAALFILIAGFCARLSGDLKKRALALIALALGISLITIVLLPKLGLQDTAIWFGILHFMGCAKLLFAAGKKVFDAIPALLGILLSLLLFFFTANVGSGELYLFGMKHIQLPAFLFQTDLLAPFGLHTPSFVSWDYFPLLPYFFLFLFGSFLGKWAEKERLPEFCYKKHMLFFGWLGRHTLWVYVFHLPVLYGLFYLYRMVFPAK